MTWIAVLMQAGSAAPAATPGTGGEGSLLIWGIVLLTVAAALVFVELIVPSGGLLGLAAAGSAVGGLVCLTYENTTVGMFATLGVLLATPFILGFMLKVWPNTPIGKLMVLGDQGSEDVENGAPAAEASAVAVAQAVVVGAVGKAITPLRPVGTCLIDGRRVECLADGTILDAGTAVKVVDVDGNEVHVRAVDR